MPYIFKTKSNNPQFNNVEDVTPEEVLKSAKELVLIDVREVSEFNGGHVPGSDLIVLSTIEKHIQELPKDKSIVFICRSGSRSAHAAAFAKASGFTHVYNMIGGILLWSQLQFPIEK